MKKSTKAILLTAITMTFSGCSSCEQYDVYGPAPDIRDNTNDISKNIMIQELGTNIEIDNVKEE